MKSLQIYLLALIQFTNLLDANIMIPLGPSLTKSLGISDTHFGLLLSSYFYGAFLCGIIGLKFIDRKDKKTLLLGLYGCFFVSMVLCAFSADNFYLLLFGRTLSGLSGGMLTSSMIAIIGDLAPAEHRGSALGTFSLAGPLAAILGIPLGLVISENYSYQYLYGGIAIVAAILLIWAHFTLPSCPPAQRNQRQEETRHPLWRDTNAYWGILKTALVSTGSNLAMPFLATFLVYNVGLNEKGDLPILYLVAGTVTILIAPLAGRMADHKLLFSLKKNIVT